MDNEMPAKDSAPMPAMEKPASPMPSPAAEPMKSGGDYNKEGGYGKKGGWGKWILIYVIIAIVVYGVIYYFVKQNGADTGGSSLY